MNEKLAIQCKHGMITKFKPGFYAPGEHVKSTEPSCFSIHYCSREISYPMSAWNDYEQPRVCFNVPGEHVGPNGRLVSI